MSVDRSGRKESRCIHGVHLALLQQARSQGPVQRERDAASLHAMHPCPRGLRVPPLKAEGHELPSSRPHVLMACAATQGCVMHSSARALQVIDTICLADCATGYEVSAKHTLGFALQQRKIASR